jgi:methylenetetrahydrofolate dehydrogenase (NADP+)/methenyltetrahydrofolate cyclohydrolase
MPLPEGISTEEIQNTIALEKDVEGVNPGNMGLLVLGKEGPAPCTAMAVMELIKSTGVDIKGKEVTVVGHSAIVGKPITLLLLFSLTESATPTVCHIATQDLSSHTKSADILIVAVGKAGLIKGDMIKPGAMVIDVGINRTEDGIKGDVVFEEASEIASKITPVPGGVGPVTTAILLRSTIDCWKRQL